MVERKLHPFLSNFARGIAAILLGLGAGHGIVLSIERLENNKRLAQEEDFKKTGGVDILRIPGQIFIILKKSAKFRETEALEQALKRLVEEENIDPQTQKYIFDKQDQLIGLAVRTK